jgi:glycosyltransferase involved in cell wall biosynthesis
VWRPYPIDPGTVALGPDPRGCRSLFAGGAHLRDGATLIEALWGSHGRPVDVVGSRPQGAMPDRLRHRDRLPLDAFYAQLQARRVVILTLEPDPHRAAGISVLALAQAAGRPIVATATPATIDHLTHGVDALLVPAHDATALREAIARLESDDDLLDRLAAGARAAAAKATVQAWARQIVHGSPAWPLDRGGVYGAW